jgi:hypothetical protein
MRWITRERPKVDRVACPWLIQKFIGLARSLAHFADDHAQLRHGFVVYDALYAWLNKARGERHDWNPQKLPR